MKRKRILTFVIALVFTLAVFLSPIGYLVGSVLSIEPQYSKTLYGELNEKYDRLRSLRGEQKIVIIGGSSVAFGIDSAMIEKYTSLPVVNFGLYAALGTKLMLDLSRSSIGKGDIVILAPEADAQTLSLYFSSLHTLRALDDEPGMARELSVSERFSLLAAMWDLLAEKRGYRDRGTPDPEGVYNSGNFNEYGDMIYPRRENIMAGYADENSPLDLSPDILSDDFAEYLNDYISYCESRGATVYFSYCPMNELALTDAARDGGVYDFDRHMRENIKCEFITDINSSVMNGGYFYDSNFHLNDYGVTAHTVSLLRDLLLAMGIPRKVEETVPEPPPLVKNDYTFDGTDENEVYFTYEHLASGGYRITGLSDLGLRQRELTLPIGTNGEYIVSLGSGAFSGSEVLTVRIPAGTRLNISNGAFDSSKITDIWIYEPDPTVISPPRPFADRQITVHIPRGSGYRTDYFWSEVGIPSGSWREDAGGD